LRQGVRVLGAVGVGTQQPGGRQHGGFLWQAKRGRYGKTPTGDKPGCGK